jgi:hypothetical protein
MPNALNARIGRIRPSPAFAYLSEIPEAETERFTARRRPADRGSLDAVQSVIKRCIARVFRAHSQHGDRPDDTSAIGR